MILQVKIQPLFRLLVITLSILGVLITQWQLSAINLKYPNLDHNFALPQLMAECNCEDLDPIDSPR